MWPPPVKEVGFMITHEFLQILWFLLVSVLFVGYFFLEGFDYGAGALVPLLGKTNNERRLICSPQTDVSAESSGS